MKYHTHISYQSMEGLIKCVEFIIHSKRRNYLRCKKQGIVHLHAPTGLGTHLGQAEQVGTGAMGVKSAMKRKTTVQERVWGEAL